MDGVEGMRGDEGEMGMVRGSAILGGYLGWLWGDREGVWE